MTAPYRAAVVGCRMGRAHARALAENPAFELVAVCDLDPEQARAAAAGTAAEATVDYAAMLRDCAPQVVAVATPTVLHAEHVSLALEAGAGGICCEKPMAVNLGDARAMVAACRARGAVLIVNHQRRLGPDLLEARRLIDEGAIGDPYLLRGHCAGDLLSDGSHLVDSLLWLAGDPVAEWVFGQAHCQLPAEPLHGHTAPGVRFGHRVEAGALAVVGLAGGARMELFCGDLREPGRIYQDYEVFGAGGTLWRTDDGHEPNLFIADGRPGDHAAGWEGGAFRPVPGLGPWRAVPGSHARGSMRESYRRFADTLATGAPHPLNGDTALRGLEVLMAVLESSRLRRKIALPLGQEAYPLDLMAAAGT